MKTLGTDGMECNTCGNVIGWDSIDTHTHDSIEEAIAAIDAQQAEWGFVPATWTPSSRKAATRFSEWMTK